MKSLLQNRFKAHLLIFSLMVVSSILLNTALHATTPAILLLAVFATANLLALFVK